MHLLILSFQTPSSFVFSQLVRNISTMPMSRELRSLLVDEPPRGFRVHQEVAKFIESKVYDRIDLFAMAVESQGALKAKFIDPTGQKDNDIEEAKLRLAWRSATEQTDRSLKRGTDLDAVRELDTPLQPGVQGDMERAFLQIYSGTEWLPVTLGAMLCWAGRAVSLKRGKFPSCALPEPALGHRCRLSLASRGEELQSP